MNLHAIASGVVAAVNPMVAVRVRRSTGFTTGPSGRRTPTYADAVDARGQVQPLSTKDLMQLQGLNVTGIRWKVYLYGVTNAVVRAETLGGDLVDVLEGPHQGTWLVTQVLEQFPDWVCAGITLQSAQSS